MKELLQNKTTKNLLKKKITNNSFINIKKNRGGAKTDKKTFETEEDVENWCKNPTVDPISKELTPMSTEYKEIWNKSFDILRKTMKSDEAILNKLPKNHLLFNGKMDLLYYDKTNHSNLGNEYNDVFEILTFEIEHAEIKNTDTVFDRELVLFKNLFSRESSSGNYEMFEPDFKSYCKSMVEILLDPSTRLDFNQSNAIENIITSKAFPQHIYKFIKFMNESEFSNKINIISYFKEEATKLGCPKWIKNDFNELYSKYEKCRDDINKLLILDPSIIENRENKSFHRIKDDPIEKYFKQYENALALLKQDKYKKLIDPDTFKPVDISTYLTESQYIAFKKEKDEIESDLDRQKNHQLYKESLKKFNSIKNTNPGAKSPTPPKRYTIKLPNKPQPYREGQALPQYIPDSVIKSFRKDYEKSKEALDEYVKVKNMPYLQLVKYIEKKSPSKEIKDSAKDNKLLSMTREQINENILNDEYSSDESQLQDRCISNKDIITNADFDSDDYPLAKLQLMVRLKIKNGEKYKTECLYAPEFYNYFVESINRQQPFVSPATKIPYTEEHIDQLMKVMKIIDPNIERPYFVRPIKDKNFTIEYSYVDGDDTNTYGLQFVSIDLYRSFGDVKYQIYNICVIPINIGSQEDQENVIGTGSTDLTSATMLFRIVKLFRDGRLLFKYIPPYSILGNPNERRYIKMDIHFNNYARPKNWTWDNDLLRPKAKHEIANMFIRYAQEINNYF